MNSKKTWFGAAIFSAVLLFFTLLSPALFALEKTDRDRSVERYFQLFQYVFSFVENNAEGRSGVAQLMGPTVSHLEVLLQGDSGRSLARSTPVFSQIPALREWAKGMFE